MDGAVANVADDLPFFLQALLSSHRSFVRGPFWRVVNLAADHH